jgi:hypothetical protein
MALIYCNSKVCFGKEALDFNNVYTLPRWVVEISSDNQGATIASILVEPSLRRRSKPRREITTSLPIQGRVYRPNHGAGTRPGHSGLVPAVHDFETRTARLLDAF